MTASATESVHPDLLGYAAGTPPVVPALEKGLHLSHAKANALQRYAIEALKADCARLAALRRDRYRGAALVQVAANFAVFARIGVFGPDVVAHAVALASSECGITLEVGLCGVDELIDEGLEKGGAWS